MAKKTFKIGEYAKGGIIEVNATATKVTIIGKEWDHSTGTRKSSDQSNAKEFTRKEVHLNSSTQCVYDMIEFLNDLTTSHYADEIMKWIKSKVKLPNSIW